MGSLFLIGHGHRLMNKLGLIIIQNLYRPFPTLPLQENAYYFLPKLSPEQQSELAAKMIQVTLSESEKLNMSGIHWLFNETEECNYFREQGQMFRLGCQYHWRNHNYESFDQFLDSFVSRKRKKVKQERKYVKQQKY